MRRRLPFVVALAALVGLAALSASVRDTDASTAAFTTSSRSTLEASALHVHDWLHLYSQADDPWHDTGYATRVGDPSPAATGRDEDAIVTFVIDDSGTYTHVRVLKVRTPDVFPDMTPDPAVTTVTVTVSIEPDPETDRQPISKYGVDVWGASPTYTKTIAGWGPGVRRQLNLQTKFPGKKLAPGLYEPSVVLTVKYAGFTPVYYRYRIPVRIQYR